MSRLQYFRLHSQLCLKMKHLQQKLSKSNMDTSQKDHNPQDLEIGLLEENALIFDYPS